LYVNVIDCNRKSDLIPGPLCH